MRNFKGKILVFLLTFINRLELFIQHCNSSYYKLKFGVDYKFYPQGTGAVCIDGNVGNFRIHHSSQLKSGCYIECKGTVIIGKYFHTGRNLTILSSNHDYTDPNILPYGSEYTKKTTSIHNYVWCGANVTILPGSTLEDGCIVAAGAVVRGSFTKGSIIAGNPAVVVGSRNEKLFKKQLLKMDSEY